VLSGYLITTILIREWHDSKKIDLPHFWMRRVRRLFPAIAFMICVVGILCALMAPDLLTKLRRDLLSALFWFSNWWYIFQDVSYFDAAGAPSPVNHFWSLAIEEQFYLIWPPILLLWFSRGVKKSSIKNRIVGLAAASALLMCLLYDPASDPSRVYYGTDTRAFSLLVGAWTAFSFPPAHICGRGKHGLSDQTRRAIGAGSIACGIVILLIMIFLPTYSPFLYYGGILLVSILASVLIISLVDKRNPIARALSVRPLVALGKISYGVYIWHFPLLLLMNDYNSTINTPWYISLLQIIVIIAAATFSYKFIEEPIRHGCIGRLYHALKKHTTTLANIVVAHPVRIATCTVLLIGAIVGFVITPDTATQSNTSFISSTVIPDSFNAEGDGASSQDSTTEDINRDELLASLGSNPALDSLSNETLSALAATRGETALERACNTAFLMIGDSVSVAIGDVGGYGGFGETFPNAILDALINRKAVEGADIYNSYVASGWDGPVVIFALATNTASTAEGIASMIDSVPAGKMVFVINARTPGNQQDNNNALLAAAAAERDNVTVIDWYSYSAGHNEYFDGDGTHLTGIDGHDAYTALIETSLMTLFE
jgi:peptidoglycan/LPS O-acetylase OafA/YrhL